MRRNSTGSLPQRQRGLALLVLVALFAMAAAYLLVSSLNKSSVALSLARADRNRDALQQAKAALIAYAAKNALTANIPGSLPCPDLNNDGTTTTEPTCSSAQRLGRLPYLTLGLEDLRDASGERLWYAVSRNFRNYSNTINSDTQSSIVVSGLTSVSNVVAVILAPGAPVGTQNRSWTGASCSLTSDPCNIASNYLENINGDTNANDFIAAVENLSNSAQSPYPFNDQLLLITQQDLMSAVEPVIAARIQQSIVLQYIYNSDPTLTDINNVWSDTSSNRDKSRYFDAWGGFPYAAPFSNPGSSSYAGQAGTYEGLLPRADLSPYNWSSGTLVKTGGSGTVSGISCGPQNGGADLVCSVTYSAWSQPTIRMSGTVPNVGLSFVQLPQLVDVSISSGSLSARTLTGSLNSAGAGVVMLDATLPFNWSFSNKTVSIDINNGSMLTSPLISTGDAFAGWFNSNQWYKQTYYAVSPGNAGGNTNCNVTNPCLSVYNLPTPYANPMTNAEAILIFAGRSLSGAARPNGTLSDYLEGNNASTGDYSFEHGLGKTTTIAGAPSAINDRVIVIAP